MDASEVPSGLKATLITRERWPLRVFSIFPDGTCQVLLEEACGAAGGDDWTMFGVCEPNPCPPPLGACCYDDGTCESLLEEECTLAGGQSWIMLDPCDPNPCPQPDGACWDGGASGA